MQHWVRARDHHDILLGLFESDTRDGHGIFPKRHRIKHEIAAGIGINGRCPVGVLSLDHDHGFLDRTVLRIVDHTAHRSDHRRVDGEGQEYCEQRNANQTHEVSSGSEQLGAAVAALPSSTIVQESVRFEWIKRWRLVEERG